MSCSGSIRFDFRRADTAQERARHGEELTELSRGFDQSRKHVQLPEVLLGELSQRNKRVGVEKKSPLLRNVCTF